MQDHCLTDPIANAVIGWAADHEPLAEVAPQHPGLFRQSYAFAHRGAIDAELLGELLFTRQPIRNRPPMISLRMASETVL
jgi:hypothetical protein